MGDSDMAARLRMTAADAEHDASCEHFREAVSLAMTVMEQGERIERLELVARAGHAVVQAKAAVDMRDPDTVAPLTAADEALAAALANLEGGAA